MYVTEIVLTRSKVCLQTSVHNKRTCLTELFVNLPNLLAQVEWF